LFGAKFRLARARGRVLTNPWAPSLVATYHPSALLRMPEEAARIWAKAELEADLRLVAQLLAQ
jgi:DNA polymerase